MEKSRTGKNKIDRFTSNGQGATLKPMDKKQQAKIDKLKEELRQQRTGKSGK